MSSELNLCLKTKNPIPYGLMLCKHKPNATVTIWLLFTSVAACRAGQQEKNPELVLGDTCSV